MYMLVFCGLMSLGFDNKKALVMVAVLGLLSAYFLVDRSAKKNLLILACLVMASGLFSICQCWLWEKNIKEREYNHI